MVSARDRLGDGLLSSKGLGEPSSSSEMRGGVGVLGEGGMDALELSSSSAYKWVREVGTAPGLHMALYKRNDEYTK